MITEQKAENLLSKVHLALLHSDPNWMDNLFGDQEIPEETLRQAVSDVLRVNGLEDMSPKDRAALTHFWNKAEAGDLIKFLSSGEKSESKTPGKDLEKKGAMK